MFGTQSVDILTRKHVMTSEIDCLAILSYTTKSVIIAGYPELTVAVFAEAGDDMSTYRLKTVSHVVEVADTIVKRAHPKASFVVALYGIDKLGCFPKRRRTCLPVVSKQSLVAPHEQDALVIFKELMDVMPQSFTCGIEFLFRKSTSPYLHQSFFPSAHP